MDNIKTISTYCLALFCSLYLSAQTVNVTTYGATPNNSSNDDYTAISNALNACKTLSNPVLVFPEGTYHITSENSWTPYFPIDGIENLTIQGQGLGAKIEFTGFNYNRHVFKFTNCKNLTVQNLKIDYKEPPFTQGKIINSGTNWMWVEVQEGFHNIEPSNKPQIKAYALYDNVLEQQISNNEFINGTYAWWWENKATRLIGMNYANNGYPNGGHILLRHKMYDGYSFITSQGCENVTYKDITVYTAPGYPFYAEKGPENISFINCRIEKKPGFWMTSTVDGAHLLDARGNITFENCHFENMGDDGINLHGYFFYINTYLASNKIRVNSLAGGWHDDAGFKIGDKCEFIENSTNKSVGVATISNIVRTHYAGNNNQMDITFTENIPITGGQIFNFKLSNTDIVGKLTVKNTTIKDNRSRAILISSSDVIIEECTFERNVFPAIKFEVSNSWKESTPARNVIIRNNTFDDTNFDPVAYYPGVITFKIDENSPSSICDVFKNIRITGNTIKNSTGPFVYAKHVQNLEVSNNTFESYTGNGNQIQYGESQNQVFTNNTGGIVDNLGSNCTPTTPAPSIVLNPKTIALYSGQKTRLSVTVSPFNSNISWTSNNPTVATVNQDGEITAGSISGNATITAKITENSNEYSDNCVVTVTTSTLSISDFEKNDIKVFPNPTKHHLNIILDTKHKNTTATIFDLSGRLLINKTLINPKNTLNLESLSEGVYLLHLKEGDKVIRIQKIIIKN